jgi:predicted SAM-dependent methyltransferase
VSGEPDVKADIRAGLPFGDGEVDAFYSEHFVEHVARADGLRFVQEAWRCLRRGGVMRVATPDLDHVVGRYVGDWRDQEWLRWPEYAGVRNRGQMLNAAMRWWDHQHLYNEEDLRDLLATGGFGDAVSRCDWGASGLPWMQGLETRRDSTLVLEAVKPAGR